MKILVINCGSSSIKYKLYEMDDRSVLAAGGIEEQARQVCENLKAVVEAAGTTLDKVVKTTCFLHDIADFGAFNAVYAEYFTSKPARSCVGGLALPKGALVEVELIAEL